MRSLACASSASWKRLTITGSLRDGVHARGMAQQTDAQAGTRPSCDRRRGDILVAGEVLAGPHHSPDAPGSARTREPRENAGLAGRGGHHRLRLSILTGGIGSAGVNPNTAP
jgi:hypothetical protein